MLTAMQGTSKDELSPWKEEVQALRKDHGALEARVSALEGRSNSPPPSSAAGWSAAGRFSRRRLRAWSWSTQMGFGQHWRSENFCDFGRVREGGATREEAAVLVSSFINELPSSLKEKVMDFELTDRKNFEITVPLRTSAVLMEIRKWWNEVLKSDSRWKFRGVRELYVVPPRSEKEKPLYRSMGRGKEALEKAFQALPAPSWSLKFGWHPKWSAWAVSSTGEEEVIYVVGANGVIQWVDAVALRLFGKSPADIM